MKIKFWMLLLIILIFTIALIPKFYLYEHKVADSFIYSHTSIAESTIDSESIAIRPYQSTANTINRHANGQSSRFVTPLIVGVLGLTTGQPLSDLQFAPICGIILIFIGFVIAKKMFESTALASVFVLILAFEPTANLLTNSTYLQGWGFVLYFVVILLILIWYQQIKKDYPLQSKIKVSALIFLIIGILLAISEFTYYTTTFYIIILLCFIGFVCIFKVFKMTKNRKNRNIIAFVLALSILALIYFFVAYDPAVGFAKTGDNIVSSSLEFLKDIGARIAQLLGLGPESSNNGSSIQSGLALTTNDAFLIGLIWYAIILIPIIILASKVMFTFIHKRDLPNFDDGLFLCLGLTGILNLAIYSSLGLFDLKYQAIVYPLLTIYAMKKILRLNSSETHIQTFTFKNLKSFNLKNKKVVVAFLIVALLLCFTFMKFELKYPIVTDKLTYVDESQNQAVEWLANVHNSNENISTIADLRMSGRIMLSMTSHGYEHFDSYVYQTWFIPVFSTDNLSRIEEVFNQNHLDYVFISDLNHQGTFSTGGWQNVVVNTTDIHNFENNITLINNIYSNNKLEIYQKP